MARLTQPDALTISDLQRLAQDEIARRRRPQRLSRAARLFLIHRLSHWAGAGLWGVAGATAACAAVMGATSPLRAAVWATMTFAAFFAARFLLNQFQRGDAPAGRPFRWRADYTAALVVLSAAFGSGAFILTPAGASGFALSGFIICAGAVMAAAAHIAHWPATAALAAPAFTFVFLAALKTPTPVSSASLVLATAFLSALSLAAGAKRYRIVARRRHPADVFGSASGVKDADTQTVVEKKAARAA
ncbi:MAG: hypothetical protein AAGC95_06300 [Pseudomonadota bacterium]